MPVAVAAGPQVATVVPTTHVAATRLRQGGVQAPVAPPGALALVLLHSPSLTVLIVSMRRLLRALEPQMGLKPTSVPTIGAPVPLVVGAVPRAVLGRINPRKAAEGDAKRAVMRPSNHLLPVQRPVPVGGATATFRAIVAMQASPPLMQARQVGLTIEMAVDGTPYEGPTC